MNGADHEQNLSEVPALIEVLKDSHALVRAAAAEALGAIGDESAATPLIGLLKDPKPKVVVAARPRALKHDGNGSGIRAGCAVAGGPPSGGKRVGGIADKQRSGSAARGLVSALVDVGTD